MANPGITKKALASALKALMAQQPLAKISVGDIVALCGMNRNSFYYHFKDKYDLVNWIFYTELVTEFNQEEAHGKSGWYMVDQLCAFLYRNRDFYINALSVSGQNSFEDYFLELLRTLLLAQGQEALPDDENLEFYVDFVADAFHVTILRWLRSGPAIPPEEFSRLIRKAATRAAEVILREAEEE